MRIEPLETRIAPAGIFTYIDVDGDKVTIKTTKGDNDALALAAKVVNGQLQLLDLSASIFAQTGVTISVVKVAGGDGFANVGAIKATDRDLGQVTIAGDLGQIDCGDGDETVLGLAGLNVRSLGAFGLATQGTLPSSLSTISGSMGALVVKTDVIGVNFEVAGSTAGGNIASISIGGSLIGSSASGTGMIQTTGNIGNITIGKGIIGGTSSNTGTIMAFGSIGNITIGGSIVGGSDQYSGAIVSTLQAGVVKITGDLVGGGGNRSGYLEFGSATSISVTGSVLGGAGTHSGAIELAGNSGAITIGGDLIGLSASSGSIVSDTGSITSITIGGSFVGSEAQSALIYAGIIGTIKIGGDVVGGSSADSARIHVGARLSSLTIEGSLIGGEGAMSASIEAGSIGILKVNHDIRGGLGNESAKIRSLGNIDSITVGGSLLGNVGNYDANPNAVGQIRADGLVGAVKITGDIIGGEGDYSGSIVNGSGNGSSYFIASVSVGGSVIGGEGDTSGLIHSNRLGPVTLGRNLVGGAGFGSGAISANGVGAGVTSLASLTIGGSVIGGTGEDSAAIFSRGSAGAVTIGGDLLGGSGAGSGSIFTMQPITSITLGGSLIGGSADDTGYIRSYGSIGSIKIGHDLLGGSLGTGGTDLYGSGYIEAQGRIGSVTVGGSIIAGLDASTAGSLAKNATIRAGYDIGSLTVTGSIAGTHSASGTTRVIISALGQEAPTSTTDLAIGKISVGGRVEWTNFLAGYSHDVLTPTNADAQIGPITVGKDWIASNAIAGAMNTGADQTPGGTDEDEDNVNFGNNSDGKIGEIGESTTISSRIVSVSIAGQVYGSPSNLESLDSFGFVAEQIGSFKVGTRTYALTAGPDATVINYRPSGLNSDVVLHEIGASILNGYSPLESAQMVNASTVTYLDSDGDKVTVKFSKPVLTAGNVNDVFTFDTGSVGGSNAWQQLRLLDLRSLGTTGLGVTITVVKGTQGDGLVHVGAIDSTGFDLGAVVIPGDLGQIEAGDAELTTSGLASLSVRSLGRLGLDTQLPISVLYVPDLQSNIQGRLGTLTVQQDVAGAEVYVNGSIGSVTINGSLIGGATEFSGAIRAEAGIGAVKLGAHLQGGTGDASGSITADSIASLTVGGSVLGGSGDGSGSSFGGIIGKTAITHNQRGGTGENSGTLGIENKGAVSIGGSLVGGTGAFSGRLVSDGGIGAVTITHNLVGVGTRTGIVEGGSITSVAIGGSVVGGSGSLSGHISANEIGAVTVGDDLLGGRNTDSGKIDSGGKLGAVTIGGSVVGGTALNSGRIESGGNLTSVKLGGNLFGGSGGSAGSIYSLGTIGPVTIGGSIVGGTDNQTGHLFADLGLGAVTISHNLIGGLGNNSGYITTDAGPIGNITLGGSLLAGYSTASGVINAAGSIGAVKIGGGIVGGAATSSGHLLAVGKVTSLAIADSIIGGAGDHSGAVTVQNLGAVTIGRNLLGGSITGTAATTSGSGYLETLERITSITIGGSISAGWDLSTGGDLLKNGSVRAGQDLGAVIVKGGLYGHSATTGKSTVILSAAGAPTPTATADVAIKSLSITGSVHEALVLAGYNINVTAGNTSAAFTNASAQIGAVTVGGNWVASSLVAGVRDVGNDGFGDADDGPAGSATTISKIASITVGGLVRGSTAANDHFGFTAGSIGSFKAQGASYPLATVTPLQVIQLSPDTGDVAVREAYSVVV